MAPEPTKEEVYDEQINPLMAQILEICKARKIAMIASFSMPTEDDPDLCCTSLLLDESHEPPDVFIEARDILFAPPPQVMAFTITTKGK